MGRQGQEDELQELTVQAKDLGQIPEHSVADNMQSSQSMEAAPELQQVNRHNSAAVQSCEYLPDQTIMQGKLPVSLSNEERDCMSGMKQASGESQQSVTNVFSNDRA